MAEILQRRRLITALSANRSGDEFRGRPAAIPKIPRIQIAVNKSISTRTDGEKLTINKDETLYFDIPGDDDETLEDKERQMWLQIDSLSFREGNKWRMTDGAEPFYAVLTDAEFLNRIAKGEVSFSKADVLHCLVHERQSRTAKGQLKKECTILRVLEHRPGAQQLKLL